jgi:hypothetical protein
MRQVNIRSVRYGIAGKPDRVVHTSRGPVPVDVKKCLCHRNGRPYDGHVAQLAVYFCFSKINSSAVFTKESSTISIDR